ncbi:MAG TPA: hypothetical protein VMR14_00610 [Streptosporangiaceae bacterium]|nr:hypothetical protein [Streptosporangiaceae bacterium]
MGKPAITRFFGVGAVALGAALLCGACGTATRHVTASPPAGTVAAGSLSLANSAASGQAAWAVLPMGAVAGPNEFWQLFLLRAGQSGWRLDTPPDIATNGAIALAGVSGQALVAGVRPSLYLAFSPVSSTSDDGRHWASDPPATGLAGVPDALAAGPGGGPGGPSGGQLLALSRSGQLSTTSASASGAAWSRLTTEPQLAATAAGRDCRLTGLTATAYSPAGLPLVAGTCARAGVAGIFALQAGSWHAAGPALPAAVAGQPVTVLRLVDVSSAAGGARGSGSGPAGRTAGSGSPGLVALLRAGAGSGSGSGSASQLVAAWLSRSGRWVVSAPLALAGHEVLTTSFGSSGQVAVTTTGGQAEIIDGPGGTWRPTPPLPSGETVLVALPADGGVDALAATGGTLTVWQLNQAGAAWTKTQQIKVPIQYGSSS